MRKHQISSLIDDGNSEKVENAVNETAISLHSTQNSDMTWSALSAILDTSIGTLNFDKP